MKRSRLLLSTATVALVATSAGITGASAAPRPLVYHNCGTFKGAVWTVAAFSLKGTTWKVIAAGTPCSYAMTWALKLVKTPNHGEATTKIVGPTDWYCLPNVTESKATSGSCQFPANSQATKEFGWGPDTPKNMGSGSTGGGG